MTIMQVGIILQIACERARALKVKQLKDREIYSAQSEQLSHLQGACVRSWRQA